MGSKGSLRSNMGMISSIGANEAKRWTRCFGMLFLRCSFVDDRAM